MESPLKELAEKLTNEVKEEMEPLAEWRQERIIAIVIKAIEQAYIEGRLQENYIQRGPQKATNLYR